MTSTVTETTAAELKAVIDGIRDAWSDNDPNAFADLYTSDATMILSGDRFFRTQDVIRKMATHQFASAHKGTTLLQNIVDTKFLTEDSAVCITEGGVLAPGESEPAPERVIRATWVFRREAGEWRIAAYQNGRLADTPLPGA
jgi:uncharacterized protein (TIGR02246 family)